MLSSETFYAFCKKFVEFVSDLATRGASALGRFIAVTIAKCAEERSGKPPLRQSYDPTLHILPRSPLDCKHFSHQSLTSVAKQSKLYHMRQFELDTADRALLDGFFLFQGLPSDLVAWTLADPRCHGAIYSRGQVIYDPIHFDRALGLVLSGKVEASQHISDRSLTLRLHQSGDVFGVAALFVEKPDYPARLTARSTTRALFFEEALLRELMVKDARAAENYIAFLTGRIGFLNQRIQSLISGSAEALLAGFLLSAAQGERTVTLDTSISVLARRLNISRASLYRAFDALEQRGFLQKSGKTILILDRDGLQTL